MSAARRHQATLAARSTMSALLALPEGSPVIVDGKLMHKQPRPLDQFGHPDTKAVLKVGYGLGRYNTEVSVERIAAGFIKIEVAA